MKIITLICFLFLFNNLFGQTMQATIRNGNTPRTIDIYLKSSLSFSQKDEAMTLSIAIPATLAPAPSLGASGITANSLGPVSGIAGLIPSFLINHMESTQREVYISKEKIQGDDYYVYAFIFATTSTKNHEWVGGEEQLILSIQFNGCTSNCDPINEMLVSLPDGGAEGRAFWYFQPNTLGDITNYKNPFYQNEKSTMPENGGSSDGSALSWISLSSAVTLPVKLSSFTVETNHCKPIIRWESASEQNLSYYSVERSDNSTKFYEIGKVNPSKYETLEKKYSFSDNSPYPELAYYRLKIVDKDGNLNYSKIVLVNLNCQTQRILSIFPTQSTGLFQIKLPEGYEKAEIRVLNSVGQIVMRNRSGTISRLLTLSRYSAGTYLVQAISNEGMIGSKKIILYQ